MSNCVGHCHSPIDLTKSRSGGCILAASPRRASSRVVAAPSVSGRYAATSKSSIAWTNAARSMGARAVTILPSVIAGSSMSRARMVLDCRDQIWAIPPSTKISLPVMKRLSSEARKLTTFATSEGTPFRPIGAVLAVWAKKPANWVSSRPTSR